MPSSKWSLLWPILLTILVPLAVAWFVYPNHLPPGFGIFPPQLVVAPPGFNLLVFLLVAAAALVITALLIFPTWFGIQGGTPQPLPPPIAQGFPWWFWVGLVLNVFFWWLMWTRVTPFGDLVYYAFTPMWWGFILFLDGVVFKRRGGYSLIASRPIAFWISALVSVAGWSYFEFFDYFVLENWSYPNGFMAALPHSTIVIIFLAAYSTVWPAVFVWHSLLTSFPKFIARYENGPAIGLPSLVWLLGGLGLLALVVIWPYPFFWGIWVAPIAVFSAVLLKNNVWNPLTSLAQGNWSPAIIIALSSLCTGFLWEFWNYGSAHPTNPVTNPNYWVYNIPYVNVGHFFSEMPALGYFGYLPFGLLVWLLFIWVGELFGFSTDINLNQE
ncbi:mechanosensitive ion channel protein MscS [Salinispirillum marinum]|uniref:Mechanosensitive ion channel protein MscS n=2 Tax=Saccharospirillaceae TaxID=255527 RepID=A0ABV8BHU4_9GAMM